MKKKIKIFSTIASLCLAVALMAFGVYAATQVTYTATSTVTFSSTDVYVQIVGNAYKNSSATAGTTAIATNAYKSYTEADGNLTPNDPGATNTTGTWADVAVALDSANTYAVYTFEITNNGSKEVTVTFTDNTVYTDANMENAATIAASTKIAAGESETLIYAAKIKNAAAGVEDFTVSLQFVIA